MPLIYIYVTILPFVSVYGASEHSHYLFDKILQYNTDRLNGITIQTSSKESLGSCVRLCVENESCLSFLHENGTCKLLNWFLELSETFPVTHSPIYFGRKLRSDVVEGKPAYQSSTYLHTHTHAGIAVDGVALKSDGSCDITHNIYEDKEPWWRVDLQTVYKIIQVTWIGRQELLYRQMGIEITVGYREDNLRSHCGYFYGPPILGTWNTVNCSPNTVGRFVQFKKTVFTSWGYNYLELCEVIVKVVS